MTSPVGSTPASAVRTSDSLFTSTAAGGAMGKNEFIKLLVAQMTHQDPLNPTDGQQMAAQLAQFSSVEQLMDISAKLDGQSITNEALLSSINASTAVGLFGRTVTAQSDTIAVGAGGTTSLGVEVPGTGGRLTLRIADSDGRTLRALDLSDVDGGHQEIPIDSLTKGLTAGTYKVAFDLTDASGRLTHPAALVSGKVDGIRYGTNGAVLTSGTLTFPIGTIVSVVTGN